jgi:hypothetical protein
VRMSPPSAKTLSEAIVLWTGFGVTTYPQRDEDRVRKRFGDDATAALLPLLKALEEDFYTSTAYNRVPRLADMARQAASEFRGRHPELSVEAVDAFAWCYSWDWK